MREKMLVEQKKAELNKKTQLSKNTAEQKTPEMREKGRAE